MSFIEIYTAFFVGNYQCWDGELKKGDGHSRVYLHIAGICLRIYCIYIYGYMMINMMCIDILCSTHN